MVQTHGIEIRPDFDLAFIARTEKREMVGDMYHQAIAQDFWSDTGTYGFAPDSSRS
jgi:hypothetical protein